VTFAAGTSAPVELAALPALAVISAALGPRWRVRAAGMERSGALWFGLVAASGQRKTPTAAPVIHPLLRMDSRLRDDHDETMAQYVEALAHSKRTKTPAPTAPRRRRVLLSDCTPEALVQVLADAEGHGVLLHSDEIAHVLGSMDGYHSGNSRMGRTTYLSTWSGSPIRVARRTSDGAECDSPFIAVFGGAQPSVLADLALRDGDGLAARFLWSIAEPRAGGLGTAVPPGVAARWADIAERCAALAQDGDTVADCDADATRQVDRLIREWTGAAARHEEASAGLLAAAVGKAGDQLLRLVALLHGLDVALEDADPGAPIPLGTVARAEALVRYHLAHAAHVVKLVAPPEERKGSDLIARRQRVADALLRLGRPSTARELQRAMTAPKVEGVLAGLYDLALVGFVRAQRRPTPSGPTPLEWVYLGDGR
jgi:hypothetical protein